jgi:hypothetical protein
MKIGILGLANSGKTTVFNALTGLDLPVTVYASVEGEPHVGVVNVPDHRVGRLSEIYEPKKTTYATVEYIDYLGITRGDLKQNSKVFDMVKDADAILHVVRVFEDESAAHPLGGVNPERDADTVEMELVLSDLELVEKRLERMEESRKRGKKPDEKEKKVLLRCREALEEERPLRALDLSDEELKTLRHLQFVTLKPEVMILNLGEDQLDDERVGDLIHSLEERFSSPVIPLSGKIEMEIAQLEEDEQRGFLQDLGITEPGMTRVIQACYRHLGLISFLTVGKDEVRAWTVRKGTPAVEAAGKIHSDIERGFIRAEVVSYDDFIRAGSMALAKQEGVVRLEGKTYEVRDGDIINFRFNV